MRARLIAISTAIVLSAHLACAQSRVTQTLLGIEAQRRQALLAGDASVLAQILADDLVEVTARGDRLDLSEMASELALGMTENSMETDNPGVIVRPPLLYGAAFIAGLVLHWFWPLPILGHSITLWPGIALLVLGLAIVIPGRRALKAVGTNVDPSLPTTAIATSGPFRLSRNPLYVGLTLFYLGLTLAFNTWWGVVLLVPILGIMHRGVVLREERYLEQKFGEAYRQYRSRVRRYL